MKTIFLLMAAGLAVSAAPAATYDATSAFVPNSPNPNSPWSYGYTVSPGGSFLLYDEYLNDGTLIAWRHDLGFGAPSFYKNISGEPVSGVAPGQIALHPGPGNELSVLRFTAPLAASYTYVTQFFSGDSGETEAYILKNSNAASPIFYASSTALSPTAFGSIPLAAGDTLDFAIGSTGSFLSDSTPLTATMANVPEPAATAAAAAGLALGWVWMRRRTTAR